MVDEWIGAEFDAGSRRILGDLMNTTVLYKDGEYRLSSVVSLFVQDCINALNKKIGVDEVQGFDVR